MRREQFREHVFMLLFRAEFNSSEDMEEQSCLYFQESEEEIPDRDRKSIYNGYRAVADKIPEIDRIINKNVEGWTTDRMSRVDLTIIRIAVYEMLFDDGLVAEKSINEAVTLAKKYGQEQSYSFINGVLARVLKQK